jgi:DNA-binding MarR family transcriptional regulator
MLKVAMEDHYLEYQILRAVDQAEGKLTQKDIAKRTGVSVASVNFALRLLAVKGLIKISKGNPRRLTYHLTPRGLFEKGMLAYNFIKRQSALYGEVRTQVVNKLTQLAMEGVRTASVYGWTPLTEASVLYLISEGIELISLYVSGSDAPAHCNKIPCKPIEQFQADCDVLVLLEALPEGVNAQIDVRKLVCYPQR